MSLPVSGDGSLEPAAASHPTPLNSVSAIVGPDGNFGVKISDFVKCPETKCSKRMKRKDVIQHLSLGHKILLADFNGKSQPVENRVCLLSSYTMLNGELAKTWRWVARVFKWEEYTLFLHVKVENVDTILLWVSLFVERPEGVTAKAQQLVCSIQLKAPDSPETNSLDEAEGKAWNGLILPTNFENEPVHQFKLTREEIGKVKFQRPRRGPAPGFNEYILINVTIGKFKRCREMCTMRYIGSLTPDPPKKPLNCDKEEDFEVIGEEDVLQSLMEREPIKFDISELDSDTSEDELPPNPYPLQLPPVLEPIQVDYSDSESDLQVDQSFPLVLQERQVLTYVHTLKLKHNPRKRF